MHILAALASFIEHRWFGFIEAPFATCNSRGFYSINDCGTLRRHFNVLLVATEKDDQRYDDGTVKVVRTSAMMCVTNSEYSHERNQVSKPERVLGFHIDSDEWRKSADIHYPIKPHEKLLNRELWVNDHLFPRLECLQNRSSILVLLGTHRCDIGFDTSSAKSNRDHCSDESSEASTTLQCRRRGGSDENNEADNVDASGC